MVLMMKGKFIIYIGCLGIYMSILSFILCDSSAYAKSFLALFMFIILLLFGIAKFKQNEFSALSREIRLILSICVVLFLVIGSMELIQLEIDSYKETSAFLSDVSSASLPGAGGE